MTPEPSDNPNTNTNTNTNADALKNSKGSVWRGHLGSLAFAVVAALALAGVVVSVWTALKLTDIQEILTKQNSDVSTQAVEARVSAKQAEELARETAARVALGAIAKAFIRQSVGIELVSHVISIGKARVEDGYSLPTPADETRIDADPVRSSNGNASAAMVVAVFA